jgi:hypothetical protein
VEKKLGSLAAKRGTQVDKLVQTVHENGQLIKKINALLEASVTNRLISAILQSDRENDFCLSAVEVKELTMTLSILPGVDFDPVAFKAFVSHDVDGQLTLDKVFNLIHHDAHKHKVFTFNHKSVLAKRRLETTTKLY